MTTLDYHTDFYAWAYLRSRHDAAQETGLPLATFPEACPWGLTQVLDANFWPHG